MPNAEAPRLTVEDAIEAHDEAIVEFGGRPGVLNRGAIEAAVARPYSGYYEGVPAQAAALLESLVNNHGFMDGNKRTAAQMLLLFLAREGFDLAPFGEEDVARELEELVVATAAGRARFAEIERWLSPRLAPL